VTVLQVSALGAGAGERRVASRVPRAAWPPSGGGQEGGYFDAAGMLVRIWSPLFCLRLRRQVALGTNFFCACYLSLFFSISMLSPLQNSSSFISTALHAWFACITDASRAWVRDMGDFLRDGLPNHLRC